MRTLLKKIPAYLGAKYRSCSWLSCFDSPRPDELGGFERWRWLSRQRSRGRLVDPSVRIRYESPLEGSLELRKGVHLDAGVIVSLMGGPSREPLIELGERVYVGPYAYLGSVCSLKIGADTMIGSHTYIITHHHRTDLTTVPYNLQGYSSKPVTIGRNVWIGCHVTVLPGVTIGDNAVIGAGAVVTKDIPEGETWAGVPAKKIVDKQ